MHTIHFFFKANNNYTEYEALKVRLKLAIKKKVGNLVVQSDSMLDVYQINGGFQARGPKTNMYTSSAQRQVQKFKRMLLEQTLGEKNHDADAIAR